MKEITLVTGLWDIGRSNLQEGWSRTFDHYLEKFSKLLAINCNMIIFGDSELEKLAKENPLIAEYIAYFAEEYGDEEDREVIICGGVMTAINIYNFLKSQSNNNKVEDMLKYKPDK